MSRLGAGGMGEVFLAEDVRLRRNVAIKLLPANFTSDADRLRRFELEARTASGLNHPAIVSIFDIGQADIGYFIATEFVDGQTLRRRMLNDLPVDTAVDIGIQIAAALAAAHEGGVVHRDIKPENIMVRPDGYVKLLDFGVAKLTERVASAADRDAATVVNQMTETGLVVGTMRYMSPEQARGVQVDGRSDLFSLGVVLYEMLALRHPFEAPTSSDTLVALLAREAPPLSQVTPAIPAELERIVTKALQKSPEKRYQSARDLELDLEAFVHRSPSPSPLPLPSPVVPAPAPGPRRSLRLALIAAAIVIVAAAIAAVYPHRTGAAIDSIAVLPFVNAAHDPATEYLSDGISYGVIDRLARIPALRVASFNAASRFKDKSADAAAAGRDLRVAAVLTGRMVAVNGGYSFNVELVDATDGHHLWGNAYADRRPDDLPAMEEDIARELMTALHLRLTSDEEQRVRRHETQDAEAYRLYLQGRFAWNRFTEASLREAIDLFGQAVARDRKYAAAYAGMADAYSMLGDLGFAAPRDVMPQARNYAGMALTIDSDLAEAYLSRGIVELFFELDWPAAERDLRRAKELKPNSADGYHYYGHYLQIIGDPAAAVAETKRARDFDPASLLVNSEYAWALGLVGRNEESLAEGRRILALDPNFFYATYVIAQAYEQLGRYAEAVAQCDRALTPSGRWPFIVAELGYAQGKLGHRAEAERLLQELESRANSEYIDRFLIAEIYVALGDRDGTFRSLDLAFADRTGTLPWIKVDPHFVTLRGDPRYDALLQRMRLPH